VRTIIALVSTTLFVGGPAPCQNVTARQAEQVIDILRQIRDLLAERTSGKAALGPAARQNTVVVSLPAEGTQVMGSVDAPLVMVEFSDYQCPFCSEFHTDTFGRIKERYIDSGEMRYDIHDYPLTIHANAWQAALAARCASEQGKFWNMRDRLIADPAHLSVGELMGYAHDAGIDSTAFKECVDSRKYADAIARDIDEARKLGITATPAFIIGRSSLGHPTGQLILGAAPFEVFDQIAAKLLK
jgi:protein-disulfide isomerase